MGLSGKKGVDISSLNGNVSIEKIKNAGYDFVMIRCGYGSDLTVQDDNQFENNVKKMRGGRRSVGSIPVLLRAEY